MKRILTNPRADYEQKLERVGFSFHHDSEGHPYWNESAYYHFESREIDVIESAVEQLHRLYGVATQRIIEQNWWSRLHIDQEHSKNIKASWGRRDFTLYGRFDLAYDGINPPKLLEYNADTPTSLVEAAVVQWYWLLDLFPQADQFNSIHEKLVQAWKSLLGTRIHFSNLSTEEDNVTIEYLVDTCLQGGKRVTHIPIERIGWNHRSQEFRDEADDNIAVLFKLYPWEWALADDYGQYVPRSRTQFIEPMWKSLWSNKGMLAILWELFPDHPNLLPTYFDQHGLTDYVTKPFWSREGNNITIVHESQVIETQEGPYGGGPMIHQAYFPLPDFDGNHPLLGSWIIGDQAAGMGVRESRYHITNNQSQFIPHLFTEQ